MFESAILLADARVYTVTVGKIVLREDSAYDQLGKNSLRSFTDRILKICSPRRKTGYFVGGFSLGDHLPTHGKIAGSTSDRDVALAFRLEIYSAFAVGVS